MTIFLSLIVIIWVVILGVLCRVAYKEFYGKRKDRVSS